MGSDKTYAEAMAELELRAPDTDEEPWSPPRLEATPARQVWVVDWWRALGVALCLLSALVVLGLLAWTAERLLRG